MIPGSGFTAYFDDHFGFRATLVTAQAWFKVKVLGVSSSPEVMLGRDGWLFYAGDFSMDNHRGVRPFTGQELSRWVQLFKARHDWLARRGIPMILAIPPDKIDIYPEFMPSSFRKVREQTRLDAILPALQSGSDLPVLDLHPALLRAKRPDLLLYDRTDTHWNTNGAYAGYVAILQEIAKTYPDIKPALFPYPPQPNLGAGDLVKMLGLGTVWRDVPYDPPWPPELRAVTTANGDVLIQNATGGSRRLMVFGDSFIGALIPYLARHFGETVASRSTVFKPQSIAEHHPDIVLNVMVERTLNIAPPEDPVNLELK